MVAIQTHTHTALASELLQFTNQVDTFETPEAVLNALHEVTMPACQIAVLGALLLPLRWGDVTSIELGKTAFLHKSAPKGWWEEQLEHMQRSPGPGEMLARLALAPFTMSETMQRLEPLGFDRWPFELALKYGMRDRLSCPVGGRWLDLVLVTSRPVAADAGAESSAVFGRYICRHSPAETHCSFRQATRERRIAYAARDRRPAAAFLRQARKRNRRLSWIG